ncbi:MAG: glycosyltransferase family 2 protein [Candidatus Gastranaerophilales bacterium]|nr:glycosyltransferase family 2 protein [Candidatus Gastranaerophilales bacterium]
MQDTQRDLLIIIPAYNEAKNINFVLEQLEQPEIERIADVLIMNDASSDGTNWIGKEHRHTVVSHVFNLGYGSGLQLGYKYAVRRDYKYVIQMDADGQHDACNIPVLYERLKTPNEEGKCPDIVLGSRFLKESSPYHVGVVKKFAYVLFRILIKLGTGRRIADPTTGLQGLSRRAFLFYSQYNHFDEKYPDANMIMQMLLLGFRVEEVPAVMYARIRGVSMHSGLKPVIYMFRMFFSIIAVWVRIRLYKVDMGVTDETIQ